jgi:hypothetical protein
VSLRSRKETIQVLITFHLVFNVPEDITVGQIGSIVGKYLKENPEKWTLPASVLVTQALQKAFPKR